MSLGGNIQRTQTKKSSLKFFNLWDLAESLIWTKDDTTIFSFFKTLVFSVLSSIRTSASPSTPHLLWSSTSAKGGMKCHPTCGPSQKLPTATCWSTPRINPCWSLESPVLAKLRTPRRSLHVSKFLLIVFFYLWLKLMI